MIITTSDGRVYESPDFCVYCELDSAGNHREDCPLRVPAFTD